MLITKVNVTPIIDVALVLVIILLVTAPLLSVADLPVDLPAGPHARGGGRAKREHHALRRAEPSPSTRRSSRAIELAPALRSRLAQRGNENVLVVVRADSGVPFRSVQEVLSDARDRGRDTPGDRHAAEDGGVPMSVAALRIDFQRSRRRTRRSMTASFVFHAALLTWLLTLQSPATDLPIVTEITLLEPGDLGSAPALTPRTRPPRPGRPPSRGWRAPAARTCSSVAAQAKGDVALVSGIGRGAGRPDGSAIGRDAAERRRQARGRRNHPEAHVPPRDQRRRR